MKKIIRLTESELYGILSNAVRTMVMEGMYGRENVRQVVDLAPMLRDIFDDNACDMGQDFEDEHEDELRIVYDFLDNEYLPITVDYDFEYDETTGYGTEYAPVTHFLGVVGEDDARERLARLDVGSEVMDLVMSSFDEAVGRADEIEFEPDEADDFDEPYDD